MRIDEFQNVIERMFGHKDFARGIEGTFMWFMEEVGELSADLRSFAKLKASGAGDEELSRQRERMELEFADVLAWLVTLANMTGVNLEQAVGKKYVQGCPKCHQAACVCGLEMKP